MKCPVCEHTGAGPFASVGDFDYWRCATCLATFLDPGQRPDRQAQLAQYRLHRNDPDDPAYRRFLARLAEPLLLHLPARSRGLDFGCGPGPALAAMLREAGHEVALYDVFFAPDQAELHHKYDFVTCTETAEHFHDPAAEFRRFDTLLKPGGWLGLMTGILAEGIDFDAWHYRRDPTHVVFYQCATLRFLARQFGWRCEFPGPDVALMRKAGNPLSCVQGE